MKRLKFLRQQHKISRDELALKLGVSYSTLAAFEQGIREPSIKTLIQLSNMFECSIDYLVGNDHQFKDIISTKEVKKENSIEGTIEDFIKDLKNQIREEVKKEVVSQVKGKQ